MTTTTMPLTPAEVDELQQIATMTRADELARESAADFLDDAAKHIEQNGWTQQELEDNFGHVCVMGAMSRVHEAQQTAILAFTLGATAAPLLERARHIRTLACVALSEQIIEGYGDDYQLTDGSVVSWNDAEDRTEQEVLDTLRAAAKSLR